jgi:hypothetical protein
VTIQRLLIDETHLGKIISNKTQGDGHKNKRPSSKDLVVLPKSEWIVVENCHEPVITQEEHDRILQLISARKLISTKARHQTYAFSGLIKCWVCGHSHTFYQKHGEIFMKPCWYINRFGDKCKNSGIKVSIIERLVLKEIEKFKENFVINAEIIETDTVAEINGLIVQNEAKLVRQKRALELVNDAYEYGDYTREDWIKRKKKWESEIYNTRNFIYELKKQAKSTVQISNGDQVKRFDVFFDKMTETIDDSTRNELYRTIIESILWQKAGDDIKINIKFK